MESSEHSKVNVRKEIINITSPVFIELLLGTLFGMVDMIMLGRYGTSAISTASIAAVGITNQLMFIGLSLVQSLSIGATAMVARYIGAKNHDSVEPVVKHIIIMSQLFIVIPLLFISLAFTTDVMKFLGAHQDTISIGMTYFKVIVLGFIFQAFNFSIFASLRGAGDTKTPMKINLIANLFNVIGNVVLIYGLFGAPELGILGAGISTSLSQVVASVLLVRYILNPESTIYINLKKKFEINKDIMYNLVKIGIPAAVEQIVMRLGILLYVKIIATLGTVAYATHQIGINILNLSFTPGQSFGIAASTLAGRSLGANDPDLAEKYIKTSRHIGTLIAVGMGLILFFFGPAISSLYSNDNTVVSEASKILKLMAFIQPFQCSQLVLSGGLRGAGDTVWTLISTFIGILVIRLALAYYFVMILGMGLIGAWLSVLIDQFIRWILITFRFKTNKWKYITIR